MFELIGALFLSHGRAPVRRGGPLAALAAWIARPGPSARPQARPEALIWGWRHPTWGECLAEQRPRPPFR